MSAHVLPFRRPQGRPPAPPAIEAPVYRESQPPPGVDRPAAYAVRRYAVIAGQTLLVGFDAVGEPLMEVRMPASCFSAGLVEWVEAWCREHGAPPLDVVRP